MQVLVMRHGPALDRAAWHKDDALRPLSDEGTVKTCQATRGLKYLCPRVDLIATSPLLRAAQTAEVVREELSSDEVEQWPELALLIEEDADLEQLRARLRASASTCALLVGHEPGCSRLLSLLLCGRPDVLQLKWKKAAIACVEIEGERAALKWFAMPKMLRMLAQTAGR